MTRSVIRSAYSVLFIVLLFLGACIASPGEFDSDPEQATTGSSEQAVIDKLRRVRLFESRLKA